MARAGHGHHLTRARRTARDTRKWGGIATRLDREAMLARVAGPFNNHRFTLPLWLFHHGKDGAATGRRLATRIHKSCQIRRGSLLGKTGPRRGRKLPLLASFPTIVNGRYGDRTGRYPAGADGNAASRDSARPGEPRAKQNADKFRACAQTPSASAAPSASRRCRPSASGV